MIIGAIIQVRMTSQRFPGKVLYSVRGKPLLQYLLDGLNSSRSVDKIIVATSNERDDNAVEQFCSDHEVACYRGPLDNVAGRFKEVLDVFQFDSFVRICGDSPLMLPYIVDQAVETFRYGDYDIVTNTLPRSFPTGQSVEVLRSDVFQSAYKLMRDTADFEHVNRYFYRNREDFKIYNFASEIDYSNIDLSVNTPEQMKAFEAIVTSMDAPHWEYELEEIVEIYNNINITE